MTDSELTALKSDIASYVARCGELAAENAKLRELLAEGLDALWDSVRAANLLFQNTIASIKKYQDRELDEAALPGWLADTETRIRRAAELAKRLGEI